MKNFLFLTLICIIVTSCAQSSEQSDQNEDLDKFLALVDVPLKAPLTVP